MTLKSLCLVLLAFLLIFTTSVSANTVDLLNLNETVDSYLEQGSHYQMYGAVGSARNCGPSQWSLCDSWSCPSFELSHSVYDPQYNQTYYCSYEQQYYMAIMPKSLCQNASAGDYLYYRANFYVNASDNANPDIETIIGNFGPGGWETYFDWDLNANVYPQHIYNPIDYNYNVNGNYISIDVLASVEDNTNGSSSNSTGCAISMTSRSAPIFTLRNYSSTTDYDLKITSTFTPIALIPASALSSGSGGGGSTVNLQTIENLLTSINTKITDLPTFISTVESDLSTILTGLQTGNVSAADTASRLSTVIGVLQTIAGNQLSSSALSDLVTHSDISAQTTAISTLLNTIISNQGSSSTPSVDLSTINSLLSSIDSRLSSISSSVSSTATNVYGIAQNANTQTQYQYDIASNTDYLPLIYQYLTGSSGGSTGSYDQDIASNTQSTAANTQSISNALTNSTYNQTTGTALSNAFTTLESTYAFDQHFSVSSFLGTPDQSFSSQGLVSTFERIRSVLFGAFTAQTDVAYQNFIGGVYDGPVFDFFTGFNNYGSVKIDGSNVSGSSTLPVKCRPLFLPLPNFVVNWMDPSSLSGLQSPSTSRTNFVAHKPSYALDVPFLVLPDGPGFLIPCLYDMFPNFFFNGFGYYWMVINSFMILGWMFVDLFDFLAGCLTLQNANTLKRVKRMF